MNVNTFGVTIQPLDDEPRTFTCKSCCYEAAVHEVFEVLGIENVRPDDNSHAAVYISDGISPPWALGDIRADSKHLTSNATWR